MNAKKVKFDFERALKRIREISDKMQKENLNLEESLKLFEEGNELIEKSLNHLEKAELKVRRLIEESGEIQEEDWNPEDTDNDLNS